MATRIQVKTIMITRGEGLIEECDKPEIVSSYRYASSVLARMAKTAPDMGGYDKTDFTITFANGMKYDGRVDLQRAHTKGYDLQAHVYDHCLFLAGMRCPEHMNSIQYDRFLSDVSPDMKRDAIEFLALYDV